MRHRTAAHRTCPSTTGWPRPFRGAVSVAVAALAVAACSGGTGTPSSGPATAISTSTPVAGQRITVLLPSYAKIPKPLLAEFTKQSGVQVTLNSGSFDNIHQQLVTSSIAGRTIADVSELDWSWVGPGSGSSVVPAGTPR